MLLNSALKSYTYITLLGFMGLIIYIFLNVPNIPTADEWDLSYFVERFYENKLTISDLMIPHNECRMPYPHIINLCILLLTKWNSFTMISFNMLLLLVFYFTLKKYAFEVIKPQNVHVFGIGFILIFLVIYSLKQYENIVLSFDINYYLSVIAGLWSLISLREITWKNITISMIWAHVAMYSYASGIAIWPFIVLLIWVISEENLSTKVIYSLVVISVFAVNVLVYFYNYHPAANPEAEKSINPIEIIPYALAFLSNNFVTTGFTAIPLTLIQFVSIAFAVWSMFKVNRKKALALAPLLAYGFWTISVALIVAHGRARNPIGILHALSPRYCTLSFPFTICFIISLMINIEFLRNKKVIGKLFPFSIYAIVSLFIFQQFRYLSLANERNRNIEEALKEVQKSDYSAPIVKLMLYPNPEQLSHKIEIMRKYNLSFYR